jgi:hypothetical protein
MERRNAVVAAIREAENAALERAARIAEVDSQGNPSGPFGEEIAETIRAHKTEKVGA